ncbi:MAG: DNA gyrase subunit A [Candidatus Avilachnospira sp.]|jgi:DNA gyrase subunit A
MAEKILTTEYSDEMQKSYLDYSMSVITSRAVPDIRDGLKPVQRRLLYSMDRLHVNHDKKEIKSAKITGDCMGNYHPHGDSAIYETMVVLAQGFKKSMPLVDGKGNFGSIQGFDAAASRYTEAKLQKFTDEVFLRDLDKAVDYVPTYSNDSVEPVVLPVRIPNFLLNGSEGIAVGMTTSTPCHNLSELCDLCAAYVDDREMSLEKMMEYLPGPDFPTGGIIANRSELNGIYETGQGKIKIRGRLKFEPGKKRGERDRLVVTEIPYTMIGQGMNKFMQDVADLVEAKKLPEVTDIGDQTNKEGVRIVLELKKDSDIERIKNILYKKTKLEDTFGVNMLAIAEGRPETMSLRRILESWLKFQYEIADKKYSKLLEKEEEKREIQEGLITACNIIDLIIAAIRGSKNRSDAEKCLTEGDTSGVMFKSEELKSDAEKLRFTKRQAEAILEMRLYKLIGLEIMELQKAWKQTVKNIKLYKSILKEKSKKDELIKADLQEIKKNYGSERKTELGDLEEAVYEENIQETVPCVYVQDKFGYCKLLEPSLFEKNEESVREQYKYIIPCMNNDRILIFTDKGNMYQIKCQDVPLQKIRDKGIPVDNISKYSTSEEGIIFICGNNEIKDENLLFTTERGYVKQVPSEEFETNNRAVASTKLEEGDRIVSISRVTEIGQLTVGIWTDTGFFLRFALDDVPILKKASKGVKGIKLLKDEKVEGLAVINDDVCVSYKGKEVHLNKLKTGTRGQRGTKTRL